MTRNTPSSHVVGGPLKEKRLEVMVGRFSPEVVIECMLSGKDKWDAINTYIEGVLRAKNRDGCLKD